MQCPNVTCQGLVIGETTLGGLSALSNVGKDYRNGTILDYGQLIWVTLQRAATARESRGGTARGGAFCAPAASALSEAGQARGTRRKNAAK